jgi:hypothetical protein
MLSNAEQRVLNAIELELSRTDPALAAALSFADSPRRPSGRRAKCAVRVALGLFTVLTFATSWLWAAQPPAPCPAGAGMTNRTALAAVANPNRPLPDNVGCVMQAPPSSG